MASDKDQDRELEKKDIGHSPGRGPRNGDFGADDKVERWIITDRVPPPEEDKKKR